MLSSSKITSKNSNETLNLKAVFTGNLHPHIPNKVIPDNSKAVGQIPVTEGTTPTGGRTYTVPVEVAPGRNGAQPQLNIVYNSQGSNGILGLGWSLGGLSSIVRGNKSIYYDGEAQGTSLFKDAAFYLDGVRLIRKSGGYTYETERGNIKAVAYFSGNIVKYFKVMYPNGSIAIMGFTNNNQFRLDYPVTKITDKDGNVIDFSYTYLNNVYFIQEIRYGKNGSLAHFASVSFQYYGRTDNHFAWQAGERTTNSLLFKSITCKSEDLSFRTYSFHYKSKGHQSLLSEIDCSVNGSILNPLKFYYGEGSQTASIVKKTTQLGSWFSNEKVDDLKLIKGKFDVWSDDDGLIVYPPKNPYRWVHRSGGTFHHSKNYYQNMMHPDQVMLIYHGLNDSFSSPQETKAEEGFIDIFSADIDGVPGEEVVKINLTTDGTEDKTVFKIYKPSVVGGGLGLWKTRAFKTATTLDWRGKKSVHPKYFFPGDFNGDGRIEIFVVSCDKPFGDNNNRSVCYLYDLYNNRVLYQREILDYSVDFNHPENNDIILPLDYDGDGKTDICHITKTGTHVYCFHISKGKYSLDYQVMNEDLKKEDLKNRQLLMGEFNSDGKVDLLLSPIKNSKSDSWSAIYNKGDGTFYGSSFSIKKREDEEKYVIQDMNGDGTTDLVCINKSGNISIYPTIDGRLTDIKLSVSSNVGKGSRLIASEINQGKYYSQLLALNDNRINKLRYSVNFGSQRLLTGVVNSFGVVSKTRYAKLNSGAYDLYNETYGATFPYQKFKGPVFVTAETQTWAGNKKREHQTYSYKNALLHRQGLGFRGFEKITVFDKVRGKSTTNYYDPTRFGILTKQETSTATVTNSYSVSVNSDKTAKIRLTQKTVNDKVKGNTITTSYLYDTYGNPTRETINYGGGMVTTTDITYSNTNTSSKYILGLPLISTIKKTANKNSVVEKTTWSYTNYRPATIKKQINDKEAGQTDLKYDAYGNVISRAEKSYAGNVLTTSFVYDSKARFLTRKTNPLGLKIQYSPNELGQPESITNVFSTGNLKTSFEYDNLGRCIKKTLPTGEVTNTAYRWGTLSSDLMYEVAVTSNVSPATKESFDAFGRTATSGQSGLKGQWIYTATQYDDQGRVSQVSDPYFSGGIKRWTTYSYDRYDRPSSVKAPSGAVTSYTYKGNSTTVEKEGRKSTKTTNARGDLVKVADIGGTIIYNIRGDGQTASIVAPGGITTTFKYDDYGRQTQITDPSAGTVKYGYDESGNLNKETNANGKTISRTYDRYNRLAKEVAPEMTITFNYSTDGLLKSKVSTNGTSTSYSYNSLQQLSKLTEAISKASYSEIYEYTNGRLSKVTYDPMNYTVVYQYNSSNHMYALKHGNTTLWKANNQDEFGNITEEMLGNGVKITNKFDTYGLPTEIKTEKGKTVLQDFGYSFNARTGNLNSRSDQKRNLAETFEYDKLDRLTKCTTLGVTANSTYYSNGNIKSQHNIGSYVYDISNKPYAVSGIENAGNVVPAVSQTVSYTSFERPSQIKENGNIINYTYSADHSWAKASCTIKGSTKTVYSFLDGKYQKTIQGKTTKELLYIGGSPYTAPVVIEKKGSTVKTHYLHRDYLGSITGITDGNGKLEAEYSYTAWGRLRNPANWQVYAIGKEPTLMFGRGYTGHEHLREFGLINMNARLYDPALGRFLSPDPYVQAPGYTQSFNRYSYCVNNPLRYADYTGYTWLSHFGHWVSENWKPIVTIAATITVAAVVTVATAGMGSPLAAAMIVGAASGFTSGALGTALNGGNVGQVLGSGFLNAGIGAVGGLAGGAAAGWASRYVGSVAINSLNVAGRSAIGGFVTGGIGGVAGGFVGGYAAGYLMTGDSGAAWDMAINGAITGGITGGVFGGIRGFRAAKTLGKNPWTGIGDRGSGLADDLVRVRHHTSFSGLKGIKNSGAINASRGKPYGVDVEVDPFLKPTNVNLGQAGRGSYVEFSVPRSQLTTPPGFMGGTGNAGRIVTGGSPLKISGSTPRFVRWNWLSF